VPVTVLLIDDDAAFRRLSRAMLPASGFVVVGEADTVAAGLAAARDLRPDSALVDVQLPDGTGIELAGALSAAGDGPRMVLTSSDAGAVDADALVRSGAIAFVPKSELPSIDLGALLAGGQPR
jgi:DNA-binding NarL/FixJ family response regulator